MSNRRVGTDLANRPAPARQDPGLTAERRTVRRDDRIVLRPGLGKVPQRINLERADHARVEALEVEHQHVPPQPLQRLQHVPPAHLLAPRPGPHRRRDDAPSWPHRRFAA